LVVAVVGLDSIELKIILDYKKRFPYRSKNTIVEIQGLTMSGLREKQKANRRRLMEDAAKKLFTSQGFTETTIEEIAEKAVVSAATVYNYYGTKGDLLLALVARGEEAISEEAVNIVKRASRTEPADLITEVILANVTDTLNTLGRDLWAQVVAFVSTAADDAVGPRYIEMISGELAAAIRSAADALVAAGKLHEDLDTFRLSEVLTRLERIHFLNFVYIRAQTPEEMFDAIRSDVSLIVNQSRV
jgi:AcrR family transcriptional regulator